MRPSPNPRASLWSCLLAVLLLAVGLPLMAGGPTGKWTNKLGMTFVNLSPGSFMHGAGECLDCGGKGKREGRTSTSKSQCTRCAGRGLDHCDRADRHRYDSGPCYQCKKTRGG